MPSIALVKSANQSHYVSNVSLEGCMHCLSLWHLVGHPSVILTSQVALLSIRYNSRGCLVRRSSRSSLGLCSNLSPLFHRFFVSVTGRRPLKLVASPELSALRHEPRWRLLVEIALRPLFTSAIRLARYFPSFSSCNVLLFRKTI
jgi:hypothetical protein